MSKEKKDSLSEGDRVKIYIVGEKKPYQIGTFLGYRSCEGGKKLPCAQGDGDGITYVQSNEGKDPDYTFKKIEEKRSKKNG